MNALAPQSSLQPVALTPEQRDRYKALIAKAVEARDSAYAPNSHSQVGAALLSSHGDVYTGMNCEFTRYADHAEQVATNRALCAGEKREDLEAMAVFVAPEGPVQEAAYHGNSCPCGNCRQALFELNPNMLFVEAMGKDDVQAYRIADLLQNAYARKFPTFDPAAVGAMQPKSKDPLIQEALDSYTHSFAPRTGRPEGAAVQTGSGTVYGGTKVELSSFASQPERMAMAAAFLHGERDIRRLALVGGSDPSRPETPKDINWDSLQAVAKINPSATVVHPDETGAFREDSLPEFLMANMGLRS